MISDFDAYHVVVVAAPIDPRRQERARALCLERLAWQLDAHGVELLTLEARPTQLMRRDIRTIDALRGKRPPCWSAHRTRPTQHRTDAVDR